MVFMLCLYFYTFVYYRSERHRKYDFSAAFGRRYRNLSVVHLGYCLGYGKSDAMSSDFAVS